MYFVIPYAVCNHGSDVLKLILSLFFPAHRFSEIKIYLIFIMITGPQNVMRKITFLDTDVLPHLTVSHNPSHVGKCISNIFKTPGST